MLQQEFVGELKKIDPKLLIPEKGKDVVSDFFLTLAVIFNDLKGIGLFDQLLADNYRKPDREELTVHCGEYGGVYIQLYKLVIATLHEFFGFLEKNKKILFCREFKSVLSNLPNSTRRQWDIIVNISLGKTEADTDFTRTLQFVRDNAAFHYYQSSKILNRGFVSRFHESERVRQNKNEFAYYSVGDDIEHTRFFYADAAMEEYLNMTSVTDNIKTKEEYKLIIIKIMSDVSSIIGLILTEYIRKKRNRQL